MNAPPKKRWLRFCLRTMLVALTVLCVMLAWKVRQAERQREAVAWVERKNGVVLYDYQIADDDEGTYLGHRNKGTWIWAEPPGPTWLRELIGVDYFATVTSVDFYNSNSPISDVSPLAKLTRLEWLSIDDGSRITDLSPLAKLTRLKSLSIDYGSRITDLSPLANLTRLEDLFLSDAQVTDLTPLTKVTNLQKLHLLEVPVTDNEIAKLQQALPDCEIRRDFLYGSWE